MSSRNKNLNVVGTVVIVNMVAIFMISLIVAYTAFRINVPQGHIAVLVKRTGKDLSNDQIVAPSEEYKGLQLNVLTEGRYFYNPWNWSWAVYPMIEIPAGKMGVRTRLYGDNLPYGHFLATKENQKGIVEEVLGPGRYAINAKILNVENRPKNDYVEIIELVDPITIHAGFRGVVTNLAGPMPENPNVLLVPDGYRGVQEKTLDAGTYYLNPYRYAVSMIDCRSQRFNLADNQDMGFPSKDGFWVSLDGIVEFRVKPEKAAEVFVIYNDSMNDSKDNSSISDEIVKKVVMPNARSFCRLRGSNNKGRDFIGGETRTAFQKEFSEAMQKACEGPGIEVVQALITKIHPPQAIAGPVRDREIANQQLNQYREQKIQQKAEADLAIEKALIQQKTQLVAAEQSVIEKVTKARETQQVNILKAEQIQVVAEKQLAASHDIASAILAKNKAEASVIEYKNIAEAAGWKKSVEALGGDGDLFAKYVFLKKIAPSYKSIMTNSDDGPLMEIFKDLNKPSK